MPRRLKYLGFHQTGRKSSGEAAEGRGSDGSEVSRCISMNLLTYLGSRQEVQRVRLECRQAKELHLGRGPAVAEELARKAQEECRRALEESRAAKEESERVKVRNRME